MKIHVINLPTSIDRRESIEKQFCDIGLDCEFFSAFDGDSGREHFTDYKPNAYFANTGRFASPGEIGCYASHLALWQECVRLLEPVVIMEDDAQLLPDFSRALRFVARHIDRFGFVRLESNGIDTKYTMQSALMEEDLSIGYFRKFPYGATAYAISPCVAETFIRKSDVLTGPVDLFIRKYWDHGFPLYGLHPNVVEGGPLRYASTILYRDKDQITFLQRCGRLRQKYADSIKRAIFNWRKRSQLRN